MKAKKKAKTRMIAADSALREKLCRLFGVGDRAVRNALDWSSDSEKARRIRRAALLNGGVEVAPVNGMETLFDADGTMRQYLPNGAVLEFYRADGSGHIFFGGEEVAAFENVTVPMIYDIQKQAAALR